jgi:hypothetical protein
MKIMFFYFLKFIFLTSSIKTIKNTQKNSKKNQENRFHQQKNTQHQNFGALKA